MRDAGGAAIARAGDVLPRVPSLLAIATGLWFCFLSYLLSTSRVAELIGKKGYWLDRAMGVLLVGLAAKLVLG